MPNGLTKHGTCRTSCFYGGDNIQACGHPDYVKAVDEKRLCPLDPRTELEIEIDVKERKLYFEAKKILAIGEGQLQTLTMTKKEREEMIENVEKSIENCKIIIRAYESKNQS